MSFPNLKEFIEISDVKFSYDSLSQENRYQENIKTSFKNETELSTNTQSKIRIDSKFYMGDSLNFKTKKNSKKNLNELNLSLENQIENMLNKNLKFNSEISGLPSYKNYQLKSYSSLSKIKLKSSLNFLQEHGINLASIKMKTPEKSKVEKRPKIDSTMENKLGYLYLENKMTIISEEQSKPATDAGFYTQSGDSKKPKKEKLAFLFKNSPFKTSNIKVNKEEKNQKISSFKFV